MEALRVRVGFVSSIIRITEKITNFAIKIMLSKTIIQIYGFRIVSAGRDLLVKIREITKLDVISRYSTEITIFIEMTAYLLDTIRD